MMVVAVKEVVVKLDGGVGHLEPSHVDAVKEIIREGWNFATINDEIVHLVASEAANGGAQHLRILDVATVGHHLDARLGQAGLLAALQVGREEARQAAAASETLRAGVQGVERFAGRRLGSGGRVSAGYSQLTCLPASRPTLTAGSGCSRGAR